eukprot:21105-Heterococcus_DN1.PRE.5
MHKVTNTNSAYKCVYSTSTSNVLLVTTCDTASNCTSSGTREVEHASKLLCRYHDVTKVKVLQHDVNVPPVLPAATSQYKQ